MLRRYPLDQIRTIGYHAPGQVAGRAPFGAREAPAWNRERMTDDPFPIISVDDLPPTREFYGKLGFTQTFRFPTDGEPGFVAMTKGGSTIGIGAGGDADRFGYWVYVDDVDATLERLRAAGAVVVAPPEDQAWGERVARRRDPAGNLVYLGAPL